ncbi:hypothetical protein ACFV42_44060 [Streptomyces solisilvae]|uniref:hypothetical protein n=1 Tax=Streptomyces malaysiensis TaxID=92644 RepID=UPI0036BE7E91
MRQSLAAAGTTTGPVAELVLTGDPTRPARRAVSDLPARPQHRAPVLLAVTIDDTPLDRAGPQPLLPQDRCGARHISGIDAVRVDGGYTAWT